MRRHALLLMLFCVPNVCPADEAADRVAAQKMAAKVNWAQIDAGEPAFHETDHTLLCAHKSYEKRLKDIGLSMEKYLTQIRKVLQFPAKDEPIAGKLTVYLFSEREQFTSFVRRIEKRQLDPDESGSHSFQTDMPHVAAVPPKSKRDLAIENQLPAQLAEGLLAKRAGKDAELPGWLVSGFGRASVWRGNPAVFGRERTQAAALASRNKRKAGDVWGGNLEAEEADLLRASLVDYLAYGPGASKFIRFVEGFRPGENMAMKTTAQALDAAAIPADRLDRAWHAWLPGR
jgi:hypothetical protein